MTRKLQPQHSLTIDLDEEVEWNMIDLAGNVTTHTTLHQLEGKQASGPAYTYSCGCNPFDGQAYHRGLQWHGP